jgi:hypothetical protein
MDSFFKSGIALAAGLGASAGLVDADEKLDPVKRKEGLSVKSRLLFVSGLSLGVRRRLRSRSRLDHDLGLDRGCGCDQDLQPDSSDPWRVVHQSYACHQSFDPLHCLAPSTLQELAHRSSLREPRQTVHEGKVLLEHLDLQISR